MNREILFRGKHDGEWIEGFYKAEGYDTYRGCIDRTPYIKQLGKCVSWAVDPSTVGQFTGLTDRNGVRIFEGDILEALNGNRGYVVFRNGAFMKSCN